MEYHLRKTLDREHPEFNSMVKKETVDYSPELLEFDYRDLHVRFEEFALAVDSMMRKGLPIKKATIEIKVSE
jgi:hypothetical protein